jgi:hypothetical protein
MKDEIPDWRDLKTDWQTGVAAEEALAGLMRGSLTWRIWASRFWFGLEVLSFLFLGFVALGNLLAGQLAVAAEVAVITVICLAAIVWARSARVTGGMFSLADMIELTLSRARKSLRLVYITYPVVAGMYVKAFIDATAPWPQDDLFLRRIVWLTFSIVAAVVYHAYVRGRVRRFEALQRSIRGTGDKE